MFDKHARSAGLRGSQARVLCFLSIAAPTRDVFQKDVESAFEIRPSSATGILRSLEQQNLIRRVPASLDGRRKKIVLTEKTKELQIRSLALRRTILKRLQGPLDGERMKQFMTTCNEIASRALVDVDEKQQGKEASD